MNIQKVGFDVQRSGSNAGAALGQGLYVSTTLEKALNYAKPMDACASGPVLQVHCQRSKGKIGRRWDMTLRGLPKVCVFYYCRTYYKAVRVGGEESGGHVL